MYKQISIFLLGILFFTAVIHSARLPYNNKDELDLQYQQQYRAHAISHNGLKTRGAINNDQWIDKVVKSMNRRDLHNLYQILIKRNKRDFSAEQSQFQNEMLQAHNEYRSRHCVSPLQLDDGLSRSAQNYAEQLASTETFEHSGTSGVGENLWMIGSSDALSNVNGKQPTDDWYNEAQYYNYDQGGFSTETGHFTQLVWKGTERVGAGIAYNGARTKAYVVAQYAPPGNYQDQYGENVLRPNC